MSESSCGNDAAAYALGALEPAEAAAFARHLETCAVCRDEVAAFGLVVGALPLSAPQLEAPRALRRRVLSSLRAEPRALPQRRARPWLAGLAPRPALAAMAVAIVALAFAGGIELGSGGGGGRLIRASVGAAELSVSDGHASLIVRHLPQPAPGRIYELWLQRGSGAPAPSTLFSVDARGRAQIGVPGSLRGVSRVLVTDEPEPGTNAPTSAPLIVASLS